MRRHRRLAHLQRKELSGYVRSRAESFRFLSSGLIHRSRAFLASIVALTVGLASTASAKTSKRPQVVERSEQRPQSASGGGTPDVSATRGQARAAIVKEVASVRMRVDENGEYHLVPEVDEDRNFQVTKSDRDGTTTLHLE